MERMTIRKAIVMKSYVMMEDGYDFRVEAEDFELVQKILDRLAAYEDTGLEPEKVFALLAENAMLNKENFWLMVKDDTEIVFCRNCRSHELCQMEKIFRSEGIEEPFCCRGEVRSDG